MTRIDENSLIATHSISPDDFHDCIPRMAEVADVPLVRPPDLDEKLNELSTSLILDNDLVHEIATALLTGHVVLQGPPGTGKSSLARGLADAFNVDLHPVTAHEDWSSYDVIGRQEIRLSQGREEVVPVNGHFSEAAVRCAGNIPKYLDDPSAPQATWLMIDELNRADPDKAFGELFSILGSDSPVPVSLSYQRVENSMMTVPRRFRILATINSVDKQYVNSLSQGIRRRFSFLTVDIPAQKPPGERWGDGPSIASREFSRVQLEAVSRASRTLDSQSQSLDRYLDFELIADMFETISRVRYADDSSDYPFVPIGTAPIIDALHLYLVRAATSRNNLVLSELLDWAFSIKIVPLLESGGLNPATLAEFADSLSSNFRTRTYEAIQAIASDGLYSTQGIGFESA